MLYDILRMRKQRGKESAHDMIDLSGKMGGVSKLFINFAG